MIARPTDTRFSTTTPPARMALGVALDHFAAHKPLVREALADALQADPRCVSALVFDGFVQILLARSETILAARDRYADAQAALAHVSASPGERALLEALGFAVDGRLLKAAERLELRLETDPTDFLCLKLAHALQFLAGDEKGMLATTTRVLPNWTADARYHGYVLGCHAFGLGEAGRLSEAEAFGRRAVEIAPDDAWGLHAVAHVYETRGLTGAGIVWLEKTRCVWEQCNNFAYHMAWHLALLQLERGACAEAMATYDSHVRPTSTDDFRDIANATSMLWRFTQLGFDVGDRWDELHAIARRRADDTTLVFASLHHLLTSLACGDHQSAARVTASLEKLALTPASDQAEVAAFVGAPLARALQSRNENNLMPLDLATIARNLPMLGGSHAQRDVFLRTLALIAAQSADKTTLHNVLKLRDSQRASDSITRKSTLIHAARHTLPHQQVA